MIEVKRQKHKEKKAEHVDKGFFASLFARMFDQDVNQAGPVAASFKLDIRETEKEYLVEADLPGFEKKDIKVSYEDNYLTISATRNENKEDDKDYICRESSVGEVWRQFYVENVDEEEIEARFVNGVLKLVLPKRESTVELGKKIKVK